MTRRELIAELIRGGDLDDVVVLARDPEGNGFAVLDGVEESGFDGDGVRFDEVHNGGEWPCVVLYPC